MLPLFYEIGRTAAFSAADAHRHQPETDLRAHSLMSAAYEVVIEMEFAAEPGLPREMRPGSAEWLQFAIGYEDGLCELDAAEHPEAADLREDYPGQRITGPEGEPQS